MPYTPTERNRVGEFLMQGIAGAGQNIGAAIDRHKNEARKANALRKAISLYDENMKDQVQSMGLGDLEGFITAQGMKQAQAAQESQSKFQAAQIRNFEADNALAAAQLKVQQEDQALRKRQMEALAGFARDYGQPAVPGISLPSVLQAAGDPGERLRRALANNPGAMTPDLMQTLVRYGEEGRSGANPMPLPFEAGGMRGIYSPKTGQFQADKPEPNPKDARMTVVLERDEFDRPTRTWTGSPQQYEEQFGKPSGGAAEAKPLTRDLAADFLKQAGGDKNKARELARKAGYTF